MAKETAVLPSARHLKIDPQTINDINCEAFT